MTAFIPMLKPLGFLPSYRKKLGRAVLWWKEKRLTDEEIRRKEIAELKRLMEKYLNNLFITRIV